ncbi:MAG: ribonuclease Z [Flavobacteriales bacterium]|nr:ribonuclease Z [Flavobacteriales bacterium]
MKFTVTILGSGAALPTSSRKPTAQYIECRGRKILIDCGEGTQMQFRKLGIKFQRIEHILISHLHGDHYFGLVGLLSTMHLLGRKKSIEIYAPKELKLILENQLNYSGSRLAFDLVFHEVNSNESGVLFEDDKMSIEHFPLSHKVPTSGFIIKEREKERKLIGDLVQADKIRIEHFQSLKEGKDVIDENGKIIEAKKYTRPAESAKSYAYCSDTRYYENVIPFIKNADVLYHEATFTEEFMDRAKVTMHSTARQAAKIANQAGVKRLLMGHLSARYESGDKHVEEAKEIFEQSEVVEDGNVYDLSA